jgi:SAM-dependent methyltransferase
VVENVLLDRYLAVMARDGARPGNLRFDCRFLFEGVPLRGKTMLDIGAGNGRYSCYAACAGAQRVVALEPEAAGSRAGVHDRFSSIASALGLENVELVPQRLQDYDARGETFDIVLLRGSINHLDEEACVRLRYDDRARQTYLALFEKLAALARPNGTLIVTDCSSQNLFARLGIRNPIAPSIEWHKHQPPAVWASLLEEVDFAHPRVRWASFNTLRTPGRLLLGNRLASWCLTSAFFLTMERAMRSEAPSASGLPAALLHRVRRSAGSRVSLTRR